MNNFNDNKAGLNGLDNDRIQRVIANNTSSNFGAHHAKRQHRIDERCRRMREALDRYTPTQLQQFEKEADTILAVLESQRDLSRVVVHIDMDAFFAAVEMRDDPALRIVPMAVGGDSMLSTSNYVARRFGIRSGMPGFIAKKLCADLVIVRGNYDKYRRVSSVVRSVFLRYDSNVHMGSLDEACLDITELVAHRLEPVVLPRIRYDGRNGNCVCRLPLLSNKDYEELTDGLTVDSKAEELPQNDGQVTKSTSSTSEAHNDITQQSHPEESDKQEGLNKNQKGTDENNMGGPSIAVPDKELSNSALTQPDWKEWTCGKCGKTRRALVDSVEFGTTVDDIVNEIRFQIEQETGLTCSAGIGANWLIAKVCSDMRKPNGQFRVANEREAIIAFMRDLPVRKVPGVGNVTESMLKGVTGVEKCSELIEKRAMLRAIFSELQFQFFMSIALGIHGSGADNDDERGQEDMGDRRSISIERTFTPQNVPAILLAECDHLCEALLGDCASRGVIGGRTATIKIKYASFDVVTRAKSSPKLINTIEILRPIALELLRNELTSRQWPKVRLLGVRLSKLEFVNDAADNKPSNPEIKSKQRTLADFLQPKSLRIGKVTNENVEVVYLSEDEEQDQEDQIIFLEGENEQPSTSHISEDKDAIASISVTDEKSDDEICIISSTIDPSHHLLVDQAKKAPIDAVPKKRRKSSSSTSNTQSKSGKRPTENSKNTLKQYFPMILQ